MEQPQTETLQEVKAVFKPNSNIYSFRQKMT